MSCTMLGLSVVLTLLMQIIAKCPNPITLPRTVPNDQEKFMCARLYEKSHPTATLSQCDRSGRTLDVANGEKPEKLSGWILNGVKAAVVRPGCTLDVYRYPEFKSRWGDLASFLSFSKVSLSGGIHQLDDGKTKSFKGRAAHTPFPKTYTIPIPTSTAFGTWKWRGMQLNREGGSYQCHCQVDNQALSCTPRDEYVVVNDCDNKYGHGVMQCSFSVSSGISRSRSTSSTTSESTTVSAEVGATIASVVSMKLSVSHTTGYSWSTSNSQTLSTSKTTSVTCPVPAGKSSQFQQVQAFCGEYTVATTRWRCIDTDDPRWIEERKGYKLVAEKHECTGSEIYQDIQTTIDACFNACKGKSSMFIYGRDNRCDSNGCKCWCETASEKGRCTGRRTGNTGFNLYAITLVDLGYKLVAAKHECTGSETYKNHQKTIKDCHDACKGTASMFIYGRDSRCNSNGCKCWCETASRRGSCTNSMTGNSGFDLYAYT